MSSIERSSIWCHFQSSLVPPQSFLLILSISDSFNSFIIFRETAPKMKSGKKMVYKCYCKIELGVKNCGFWTFNHQLWQISSELPLSCVFIIASTKIRKYIFGLGHVILYGQRPVSRNSNQRIEICLHGKVYVFVHILCCPCGVERPVSSLVQRITDIVKPWTQPS